MYRNDPIILGTVPRKPPSDDTYISSFLSSSAIWEQMEAAGVPGIKGVWNHEGSGSQMFITVAIEQMYPGHSKQAAMAAAGSYAGSYLNKMVVVVDDDIDPTSIDDVVWAMCTRLDPDTDLDIVRNCWSSPLDPMAYPGRPQELQQENAHRRLQALEPTGYLSQGGGGERRGERAHPKAMARSLGHLTARRWTTKPAQCLTPFPRMGCIERTERTTWLMTIA